MLKKFLGLLVMVMFIAGCSSSTPEKPSSPQKVQETPKVVLSIIAKTDTPHVVGSYSDSSKSMHADIGQKGVVVYGPYVKLEPGNYIATFDISANSKDTATDLGTVDVNQTIQQDKKVLGNRILRGNAQPQKISIDFSVSNKDATYEFRVISNGTGTIDYRGVEVKKVVKK